MCACARTALLLGLRTSGGARTYTYVRTCTCTRVESLVTLACVRVKWSKQPKRRPEWRMAETYEVESFVRRHHVFNCVWSPTVGEQLYCARGRLATRVTCMLWRLYACGHNYTCVRVHVVYVHRYMDIARADYYWREFNLAVLRSIAKSPN